MNNDILDLDAFAPQKRRIRVSGKEYLAVDLLDLNMAEYLDMIQIEQNLKGKSEAEQLHEIVRQIRKLVPDLPEKVLRAMSMRKLGALIEMLRSTDTSDPRTPVDK